ncbi:MAG: hypothetical protein IJY08_06450 [Clostridia bacterium]|nr:hypothetical protein [Clostridia bacterium]
MKKLLILLICLSLVAFAFAACNDTEQPATDTGTGSAQESGTQAENTEETTDETTEENKGGTGITIGGSSSETDDTEDTGSGSGGDNTGSGDNVGGGEVVGGGEAGEGFGEQADDILVIGKSEG